MDINIVKQKITVGLKDVYPENNSVDIKKIFSDLPKSHLLGLVRYLMEETVPIDDETKTFNFLEKKWFSHQSIVLNDLRSTFDRLRKQLNVEKIIIFNLPATLRFLEYFLECSIEEFDTKSSPEREDSLMLAYLKINDEQNAYNAEADKYLKQNYKSELLELLLIVKHIQYTDLINFTPLAVLFPEIIKTISLFQLLEKTTNGDKLIQEFLTQYDCTSWDDFVCAYFFLIIPAITNNTNDIRVDENQPLSKISLNILKTLNIADTSSEYEVKPDFILLRERPIILGLNNTFRIIHLKFLIEKVHKSLFFSLNNLNKNKLIKNFHNNFYPKEFIEETVVYDTLNIIFENAEQILRGKEMETIDPNYGAIDYIATKNQDTFLFESKSVLIRKEDKVSLNPKTIRAVLQQKFVLDDRSDKAIRQLSRNILNFCNGDYKKKFNYDVSTKAIYPVIVINSENFIVHGLESLLNKWFDLEIQTMPKDIVIKVKKVVVIDTNTLIQYEDVINSTPELSLNKIIDAYIENTIKPFKNKPQALNSKFLPFAYFLKNYCSDKEIKMRSKRIEDVINRSKIKASNELGIEIN